MLRAKVYSQKVNSWDVLVSSLEARIPEVEWLRPLYEELVELVAEMRSVVVEQEAARAEFHEKVAKRQELERQGVDLRGRIAAHLKAYFGFRNEQLRQFGLTPLPRVIHRKSDEGPVTEPPEVEMPAEPDAEDD